MTSGKFIPGIDIPQWRVPAKSNTNSSYLWQRHPFSLAPENMIKKNPEITTQMREKLCKALKEVTCPPETFKRLGLKD
jgi:hypothetical protein